MALSTVVDQHEPHPVLFEPLNAVPFKRNDLTQRDRQSNSEKRSSNGMRVGEPGTPGSFRSALDTGRSGTRECP